jgi:hypothetical protein
MSLEYKKLMASLITALEQLCVGALSELLTSLNDDTG